MVYMTLLDWTRLHYTVQVLYDTIVYDIADDLHWKQKKNYTLEHAAERIKIYSKEKFDYELFEINI